MPSIGRITARSLLEHQKPNTLDTPQSQPAPVEPRPGTAAESTGITSLGADTFSMNATPHSLRVLPAQRQPLSGVPTRGWVPSLDTNVSTEPGRDLGAMRNAAESAGIDRFRTMFGTLANDPDGFHGLLRTSLGEGYDREAAESLRQRSQAGDFGWLPEVSWVDPGSLNGGAAAYDAEAQRIYLSRDLEGTELANQFLTEEIGHHLDHQLNDVDARGDEGEIFQRQLFGEELSDDQLEALRNENDHGTIDVDGESRDVEFGFFSRLGRAVRDNIIDPAVDIVEEGVDVVVDHVENVADGVFDIATGHVSDGVETIVTAPVDHAQDTAGFVVDSAVTVGVSGVGFVDDVFGLVDERGLTEREREDLERVFRGGLDYDAIRIHRGGTLNDIAEQFGSGDRARAVRNDIYFPDEFFGPNGELNERGLRKLTHEAAHVQQYQRDGIGYISDAFGEQIEGGAYDWAGAIRAGTPFESMGVEQQAELVEDIGRAIRRSGWGVFTQPVFEDVTGLSFSAEEFARVRDALAYIRR